VVPFGGDLGVVAVVFGVFPVIPSGLTAKILDVPSTRFA
jgi:hypothetical protein